MSTIVEATPLVRPAITPFPKGESCVLVIFGASGDLTRRKLLPALYDLACLDCVHPQFDVLGVGRTPMSTEEFRVRTVVFLVQGQEKAPVLREVLFGPVDAERLPAQLIAPEGKLLWMADEAAASRLPQAERRRSA